MKGYLLQILSATIAGTAACNERYELSDLLMIAGEKHSSFASFVCVTYFCLYRFPIFHSNMCVIVSLCSSFLYCSSYQGTRWVRRMIGSPYVRVELTHKIERREAPNSSNGENILLRLWCSLSNNKCLSA